MKTETQQPTKRQIKLVIKEIEGIKLHATKEEKKLLDFDAFHPHKETNCIYGLMTGSCFNKRAGELIKKSKTKSVYTHIFAKTTMKKEGINDCTEERILNQGSTITSLENFIARFPSYNKNILGYIKGTSKRLKLYDLI